jgi:hypothetical protein
MEDYILIILCAIGVILWIRGLKRGTSAHSEISGSYGDFAYSRTNPVAVSNVILIYKYLDSLRYSFTSKSGKIVYFPVQYKRTSESDNTPVGASIEDFKGIAVGTHSYNIGQNIDVFNLYDIHGKKLALIYLHGYQNFTSTKAPCGFYFSDDIPKELDAQNFMDKLSDIT